MHNLKTINFLFTYYEFNMDAIFINYTYISTAQNVYLKT